MGGHGFLRLSLLGLWISMLFGVSKGRDLIVPDEQLELPARTVAPSITLTVPYPGQLTGEFTTVLPADAVTTVGGKEEILLTVALPGVLTGMMTVTVSQEPPIPTTLYETHTATVNNQPVTITVAFPYPSTAPGKPKAETFDCKTNVKTGWPEYYTMSHSYNQCYPLLWPTCIREAKAAFAKFRDFCGSWNRTMGISPHRTCRGDGYVPDDGEERYFMDQLTMWLKVKTCCYSNDRPFDDHNEWCKIYRIKEWDEWEYYTQNFGVYGVYDEDFIYNLSEEHYDPGTGQKEVWGHTGEDFDFPGPPTYPLNISTWKRSAQEVRERFPSPEKFEWLS